MTKVKEFRIERTAYLTTGTSTAYAVTATGLDPAIDFEITIEPHLNCAAWPITLNVNGSGAITIKWPDGNDLVADDLVANVPVKLYFDASQSLFFLLVSKKISGWNNNYILGWLGNYIGSYAINTWSQVFSDPRWVTIEVWNYIYIFCLISRTPTGSASRWTAWIVWKIDKTTWIITHIGQDEDNVWSWGAVPILSSVYLDWTDIYVNVVWNNIAHYKVDTLTDVLTLVTGSTVTTGTLITTRNVIIDGIAYDAVSIMWVRIWATSSSDGGYAWVLEIHPTPYTSIGVWVEIESGANHSILTRQWLFFKDDWTQIYLRDGFNARYEQWNLSTPWDLSTISYVGTVSTESWSTGLFIGNSGQYLYTCVGSATDRVYRRTMSTPRLLSSAASAQNYNPTAQANDVIGVWLKSDWTKMYLFDAATNAIYQYSLSTPWQINSGVTYDSVSLWFNFDPMGNNTVTAFTMSSDWTELIVLSGNRRKIYKYVFSTAWDLSTATYTGEYTNYHIYNPLRDPVSIALKSDKTKLYVGNNVDTSSFAVNNLEEYDLVV